MASNNDTKIVEIILKGQQPKATMQEMERSVKALRAQMSKLPADSQEFADKQKELKKINDRLFAIKADLKGTGGLFQWLGKEAKAFGLIAIAALGFGWLTSKVQNIVTGNAELSDSLADVRKTTGMTEREAKKLNLTLSQMDTRTSTKELRQIAIAAGQLGIAKNDVLKFTAATDKMVVSLGDEFSGGAEEVTKVMGGLRSIFKDIATDKIDQDMLRIGNAVNVLASEGSATGPVVTDFANRIGGVGISLGLTSAQVLGLSATLQELNVGTEKGGTAVTKILQRMTTHVPEFAKVAGMGIQEFANLVNNDLFGAFQKVLEGSQKSGSSATALGDILDKLGVDGAGASEVVTKLGTNMSLLNNKVTTAGDALQSTDSIMAEFRMKNETLGAEMDRLGKSLSGAFTNSAVSNGLKKMVGFLADVFGNTKKASDAMREEQITVNALVIELKEANTTNERRKAIYEELRGINEDIVAGLDQENISIERLNRNLKEYNNLAVNKILIQKKQEGIDTQNEITAEKLERRLTAEAAARERLAKILEKQDKHSSALNAINDDTSLNLLQKIQQMEAILEKAGSANNEGFHSSQTLQDARQLFNISVSLKFLEQEYNAESKKGADLIKEKTDLERQLGLETKKKLDYSKKTEAELREIILHNDLSKGMMMREAAAAVEELERRANKASKNTKWIDPDAAKKAKKHADEIKRIFDKLMQDLAELRIEDGMFDLTEHERQVKEAWMRHDALLDRIAKDEIMNQKKHAEDKHAAIALVNRTLAKELEVIDKKHFDKLDKEARDHARTQEQMMNSDIQNEIDAVIEKYDIEIAYNRQHNKDVIELEESKQRELQVIRQKYYDKEHKQAEEKKQKEVSTKESVRDLYQAMDSYAGIYMDFQRQRDDASRDEADRKYDVDLAREQRLLDNKVISQQTFDDRVNRLNIEKANREKEERLKIYAAEKNASRYAAIMNGAQAITSIWSKYAAAPPVAAGLSILAGGIMAAQLALIEGTEPPQYAEGGLHDPNGFVSTSTLFNSASGQPFIAGEKGAEWIAPNWMLQDPVVANQIGILEAVRVRGRSYAAGGSTSTSTKGSDYSGSTSTSTDKALMNLVMQNTEAMSRLNNAISNGINANLSYDHWQKTTDSIENAKNSSRIG